MSKRLTSKKAVMDKLRAGSRLVHQHLTPHFFVEGVGPVDPRVVKLLEKEGAVTRIDCGIFEGEDYQTFRVTL